MRRIYVVNDLHQEITVLGGTGSTFLPLKTIPPRKHGSVCVNSEATFREFLVISERSSGGRLQKKFNSDEIEWTEIRITGDNGVELTCVTSLRSSHGVGGMMTVFSNSFQFILRKIGIGGMSDAPAPQVTVVPKPAVAPQVAVAPKPAVAPQLAVVPKQTK